MFFCEDDYIKIYKWLLKQGKKDSAFDETYELNGDEMITILQNDGNMKITLSELLHQVANLGCKDFYNLTANKGLYKISFSEALNEVPDNVKKIGIIITFLDTDNKWRVFHFNGTSKQQWFQTSLWEESNLTTDHENIIGNILRHGKTMAEAKAETANKKKRIKDEIQFIPSIIS